MVVVVIAWSMETGSLVPSSLMLKQQKRKTIWEYEPTRFVDFIRRCRPRCCWVYFVFHRSFDSFPLMIIFSLISLLLLFLFLFSFLFCFCFCFIFFCFVSLSLTFFLFFSPVILLGNPSFINKLIILKPTWLQESTFCFIVSVVLAGLSSMFL